MPKSEQKVLLNQRFKGVSYSKGKIILPDPLSRKFDPLFWLL
jgi:hypothetical protein